MGRGKLGTRKKIRLATNMAKCYTRQMKSWQIFRSVPQHFPMNFALMSSHTEPPKKQTYDFLGRIYYRISKYVILLHSLANTYDFQGGIQLLLLSLGKAIPILIHNNILLIISVPNLSIIPIVYFPYLVSTNDHVSYE